MYLYDIDSRMFNDLCDIHNELNNAESDVYHDALGAFMEMWMQANDTDNYEHLHFVHSTLRDVGYYKLASADAAVAIIDQYIDDLPYYCEMGLVNWLSLKADDAASIA